MCSTYVIKHNVKYKKKKNLGSLENTKHNKCQKAYLGISFPINAKKHT